MTFAIGKKGLNRGARSGLADTSLLVMWNCWGLLGCLTLFGGLCVARPDGDLCKWMNGRKYYIGVGETGTISVANVTNSGGSQNGTDGSSQPRIPQRCSVELITCPSCHIVVSVLYLNIPSCSSDGSCQCDYVWVREPTVGKSGQEFCGIMANQSDLTYESKTKLLSIDFLYSFSYNDAFSLQFTAEGNSYEHIGQVDYRKGGPSGYVESPHFPIGYPSDYSAEHALRNLDSRGFVQLVFTDFQLSPWSYVEILDGNGSRVDVYNGNTFRPPVLVSTGPSIVVRFRANDEYPNPGFRAKYTFVNYPEKYWFNKPSTDCGGAVEDFGGAITMMNMASPGATRNFDCIWLVRPSSTYAFESHVSVRVAQFEEMGPESSLEIRQGLTSLSYLLESLNGHQSHKGPQGQEYITPANVGFYIRLQGTFSNKSRVAIVYSTFSYETVQCQDSGDFECGNGRCIKSALHCDGFNHCGDGSDEAACYPAPGTGRLNARDSNWWRSLTPNYYFPKPESTASSGTNTLILITSLAGLGMFVLTTVMILVKLHKQRRMEVVSRGALHTVSAEVEGDRGSVLHGRHGFGPMEPPLYDPPPSYEDVIKFYMPPPPAYNAIVSRCMPSSTQQRPAHPCPVPSPSRAGVENTGFVPDEAQMRHQQARGQVQHSSKALHLLKVVLPPTGVFERRSHRQNKSPTASGSIKPQSRSRHEPSSHARHRSQTATVSSSANQARQIPSLGGAHVLKDECSVTPPPSPGMADSSTPSKMQCQCQCQGACSCPSAVLVTATAVACRPLYTSSKYRVFNQSGGSTSSAALSLEEHGKSLDIGGATTLLASKEMPSRELNEDGVQGRGSGDCTTVQSLELNTVETTVNKDTQPLLRRTSSLPELQGVLRACSGRKGKCTEEGCTGSETLPED